jgi:ankyrin repeat protein
LAREHTQGSEEQAGDVFWPADLACITIPDSRILTYGYDTHIRHWAIGPRSQNTVRDHARDLMHALNALRQSGGERCRPVLFVAHSLGGIVVKEALRQARNSALTDPCRNVLERTFAIMFFGTPHRGADPRNIFHHVVGTSIQLLGFKAPERIVNNLMPNAEQLAELREDFITMTQERGWRIWSFQEEYPHKLLFGKKVVNDQSSCLGVPTLESKQHISRDHVEMCRFAGLEDPEYRKVADALAYILNNTVSGLHTTDPEPSIASIAANDLLDSDTPNNVIDDPPMSNAFAGPVSVAEPDDLENGLPSRSPPAEEEEDVPPVAVNHRNIDEATKRLLLEKLYFDKVDERLTSLTAAQKDTCRWFLAKPEYVAWQDMAQISEDAGFLWIKGNPGTGKSTLMKLLFENTMSSTKHDPTRITISFFFLARGAAEEKSTIGLYRSLLYQLFEKDEDLKESLEWMTSNGAKGLGQNGWSEAALKQTLSQVVERLGERCLTIFVDALDECNQDQAAGMVEFFEELCELAIEAKVQLRICFSSRHYPTIMIKHGAEVTLEEEAGHTEDIQRYIKAKLRLGKTKNAEPLRGEILEKSSGIFLWVVLVLDILKREYPNSIVSVSGIRERLRQIPPRLHDLFEMILDRDAESIEQLHVCLKWILFAARPLRPEELYFAVKLGVDQQHATLWDQEDIELDQMKLFVSSASKGLAEVARNKSANVQFIHESVRDFLFGRYRQQHDGAGKPGNFEGHCHDLLKASCLLQLIDPAINRDLEIPIIPPSKANLKLTSKMIRGFPFLEYAVVNILNHSDSAQQHSIDQSEFLQAFPLLRWLVLYSCLQKHGTRLYTEKATMLYLLAERNLCHLISIYEGSESCFDAGKERYGAPVLAARAMNSHEALQTMLQKVRESKAEAKAAPDLWPRYGLNAERKKLNPYGTSFQYAPTRGLASHLAEHGDTWILLHALSFYGSDIYAQDRAGRTPLAYAARKGHSDVVRILVDRHAPFNSKDINQQTPLSLAAAMGHEDIVQLLLEMGADVNTPFTDFVVPGSSECYAVGAAPLSYAAQDGHDALVTLLLDAGATVDYVDGPYHRTPLATAAGSGRQSVVEILLREGADPNSSCSKRSTPLCEAAKAGHEAIVALLLEAGAKPDAYAERADRTPLAWAASHGHEAVASLLIKAGAKPDAYAGGYDRTPLAWAAYYGYEAVASLLLEAGAQIETSNTAMTPLGVAAASSKGHGVLSLLLEKVGNVNCKSKNGRTALSDAASAGQESAARLLLAKGAEVDLSDSKGRTPLSYAAQYGYAQMVEFLIKQGADPRSTDSAGRSLLTWAANVYEPWMDWDHGAERVAIMEALFQHGADVDTIVPGRNGRSLLSLAAERSVTYYELVRYLLGHDTAVEGLGPGRSPLAWAATQGVLSDRLVRLFLNHGAKVDSIDAETGRTPLSWAAEAGAKCAVECLLTNGADANIADFSGHAPLWWAQKVMSELEGNAKRNRGRGMTGAITKDIQRQKEVIELLLSKAAR